MKFFFPVQLEIIRLVSQTRSAWAVQAASFMASQQISKALGKLSRPQDESWESLMLQTAEDLNSAIEDARQSLSESVQGYEKRDAYVEYELEGILFAGMSNTDSFLGLLNEFPEATEKLVNG
jgi:hypothetical protein